MKAMPSWPSLQSKLMILTIVYGWHRGIVNKTTNDILSSQNTRSEKLLWTRIISFTWLYQAKLVVVSFIDWLRFQWWHQTRRLRKSSWTRPRKLGRENAYDTETLVKETKQKVKRAEVRTTWRQDNFETVTLLSVIRESLIYQPRQCSTFVLPQLK